MSIYGITVDLKWGFDVFRGAKLVKHFDSYAEARAYADSKRGCYVRYWAA